MRLAYIRPEPRLTEVAQQKLLTATKHKTVTETKRGRGSPYKEFQFLVGQMMKPKDELEVSHWHRLGSTIRDMFDHARQVMEKGVPILEMSTGRRSDRPLDLLRMVEEAVDYYAGRSLSKDEARRLGKLGAIKSPMTKVRTDRMPNAQAEGILNNHGKYPTLRMALAAINSDKRYARQWSAAHVYREVKRSRLRLRERKAGRPYHDRSYDG